MHALEPYMKKSAPGHADILRKFGAGREDDDHCLRRLIVTLDLTLTDMGKPPSYRAKQAEVFLGFNNDRLASLFEYARVITCDAFPRENKSTGAFENNMRLWVLEEDVDKAVTLLSKERWVAKIEPEAGHIIYAANQELVRASGVTRRPTQEPVRLSL